MRHTPAQLFTQWKRAALMKDRTRRAIRDRRQAGESVRDLAADYDVPEQFVRGLCEPQLFGDDDAPPVERTELRRLRAEIEQLTLDNDLLRHERDHGE